MDLSTEGLHASGLGLDQLAPRELAELMSRANREAVEAVAGATEAIARAIELCAEALAGDGRLVLVGAGTSARVAVSEAAECPPTFDTDPSRVIAIPAGGDAAMLKAIEGAEDDRAAGEAAIREADIGAGDFVLGISASARAPFVRAAVEAAAARGASTGFVTSNPEGSGLPGLDIVLATGPEVLSGSTRLKAATAAKCALNAITTGAMARLGRIHGQLMVEVRPTNEKLRQRAARIIATLGEVEGERAEALLEECEGDVKEAIVRARLNLSRDEARARLEAKGRRLREIIG